MLDNLQLPKDLTDTLKRIYNQVKQHDQSMTEQKIIKVIFSQWLDDYSYSKGKIYIKDKSILKNNLKLAIELSGKKQKQIADEIGINKNYLNQIIQGKYEPSIKVVLLILTVLNYHPKKLHDIFWLEDIP